MSEIILDIGSGRSLPDKQAAFDLIDAIEDIDVHRHSIVFKVQLFADEPPNIPLDHDLFREIYRYATCSRFKCTASVFDPASVAFLLQFDVPFIKLACRPDKYVLESLIPRGIVIYRSISTPMFAGRNETNLVCVPHYPAAMWEYDAILEKHYCQCISDHTVGLDLWRKYRPTIWEKHLVMKRSRDNPDSGPFAVTPEELKEVIG